LSNIDRDEATETNEDPYGQPDKDETMPGLSETPISAKPIRKVLAVPELSFSQQRNVKVIKEGQKTSRQLYEERMLKSDKLRQKYDLRNKDPKDINDIFLRAHIQRLKEKSKPS
jgi:hypothetical protein